jgi:hypothetical protein
MACWRRASIGNVHSKDSEYRPNGTKVKNGRHTDAHSMDVYYPFFPSRMKSWPKIQHNFSTHIADKVYNKKSSLV